MSPFKSEWVPKWPIESFFGPIVLKKNTVSNELPYYISGHHGLPTLIPAKMHVLQTNGNTNVY